jgi:two-component system, cell cycle response regulator DivK
VIRILYVEDNEDNVYMLKMRLELTDEFEVLVAGDGEKGCAMARQILVIGLSAHALAGEREKALAAGCEDFDTKPVEFDRLLAKIKKLLEQKRG